jgi:hypothetical protein
MQPHAHIAQTIERAWQHQDLVALGSVLADTLNWYQTPGGTPLTTKQQVLDQWQRDLATQSGLQVHVTLLDFVGPRGYHHCTASWHDTRAGSRVFNGLFQVELGPDGKIISFTQWTASRA